MDSQDIKSERWNSGEYPVTVNSIRFNQDYSLLTLGTSKGYRIFSNENFKSTLYVTDVIRDLGDLNIVMTYYKSSLVFFLASKDNPNYSLSELVVFDDLYQKKFASFKVKSEEIINFFVSKNIIIIITLSQIIILELLTFKIIEIIENVNTTNKLLSFNFYDFVSFTKLNDKKTIYTHYYINKNHKIQSNSIKKLTSPFDLTQLIQLSPNGAMIAVVSMFGNKIHLYYTQSSRLKECIYLGKNLMNIEKLCFSKKKENYILLVRNNQKFYVIKTDKNFAESPKCVCKKYIDKDLNSSDDSIEEEQKPKGFFAFFRKNTKNEDVKDIHVFYNFIGNPYLIDFDQFRNKDIVIIDEEGKIQKYHINKKKGVDITPFFTLEWI